MAIKISDRDIMGHNTKSYKDKVRSLVKNDNSHEPMSIRIKTAKTKLAAFVHEQQVFATEKRAKRAIKMRGPQHPGHMRHADWLRKQASEFMMA